MKTAHRSPRSEYARLLAVGVDPRTAETLAYAIPTGAPVRYTRRDDDERGYWRAQAAGRRATHAAYLARAREQAARRRAA